MVSCVTQFMRQGVKNALDFQGVGSIKHENFVGGGKILNFQGAERSVV